MTIPKLRAWIAWQIEECRKLERKFGASGIAIDAAVERMTLQRVRDRLPEARHVR